MQNIIENKKTKLTNKWKNIYEKWCPNDAQMMPKWCPNDAQMLAKWCPNELKCIPFEPQRGFEEALGNHLGSFWKPWGSFLEPWDHFWSLGGIFLTSGQKSRFSQKPRNSLCFSMVFRVWGVIFEVWGVIFESWGSSGWPFLRTWRLRGAKRG